MQERIPWNQDTASFDTKAQIEQAEFQNYFREKSVENKKLKGYKE